MFFLTKDWPCLPIFKGKFLWLVFDTGHWSDPPVPTKRYVLMVLFLLMDYGGKNALLILVEQQSTIIINHLLVSCWHNVALSKVDSPILWFVDGETWKMINFPIPHQISMTAPELYLGQKYPWLGDLVKFSLEKIIDLRQKYPTNPIKIKRSKRGSMGFGHCKDMLGKFVILFSCKEIPKTLFWWEGGWWS